MGNHRKQNNAQRRIDEQNVMWSYEGLFNKSVALHRKSLNCEILLFWLENMSIMINIYVNFIIQYLFILKSQSFPMGRGQASSEIGK